MKWWMYVMVLATSHKFVATDDKMVAVCNEMVVTRDRICSCIYGDMNQTRTPSPPPYYLM